MLFVMIVRAQGRVGHAQRIVTNIHAPLEYV
jgi:hypothetical protein